MKKSISTVTNKVGILFFLGVLVFWQGAVVFFQVPAYILPAPTQIISALIDSGALLLAHTRVTLLEAMAGFILAISLAAVLALLMDSIPWVKRALYPILIASQTVPIISVAPLFIIWFGYGILPKIVVVTLVCFFPLVISLLDGLAAVDDELVSLLKTMGANRWQIFKIVKLPGALPSFFSGLKIAATYSIMGAVIGEWLGASQGIGVFMIRVQKSFLLDKVFAAIVVITILSMGVFGLVRILERSAMPWMYVNDFRRNDGKEKVIVKKILSIISLILLTAFLMAGCGEQPAQQGEEQKEPVKVTVVLDWVPNTNHTGLYVAKDQGFYEEEGLHVDIVQPSAGATDQLIASGQGDFGVSYQEGVTNARAAGIPIKSIAAMIQHNTSCFASPAAKNITSPKDFVGKKYGGWGSPAEHAMIKSLMDKYGADVSKVEEVNIGTADFFSSVEKDVDFSWIFYGWDGIQAELKKFPLNVIMIKDEDPALDYYTPVLIASEKTIGENPELVKKFLAATDKGYQFAIAHPEESAEILLANAPELDPELVRASQRWLADKYQDDAPQWGLQKQEVWENYARWLNDNGLLETEIDAAAAFTNDFLPEK